VSQEGLPSLHAENGPHRLGRWVLNLGSGYADFGIGGLIYLLLTPIIVGRLGVEAFAVWIVSHTITFYLHFLDLGLANAQVRFHARFTSQGRERAFAKLIATVAVALTVAGIVALIAGVALSIGLPMSWFDIPAALEGDFRTVLLILAINCLVSLPASAVANLYEGAQRFDLRNWISIVLRIATATCQWQLVTRGHGLVALAALELGTTGVRLLIHLVVIRRLVPGVLRVPAHFHRRVWQRIRSFSIWTLFDDLLTEGTQRFDAFLVAMLLPIGVLAPYALSQALAGIAAVAVEPIVDTYLPIASNLHGRRRLDELQRMLILGTKLVTAVASPIVIVLTFFGHFLLGVWVPELKDEAPPALLALMSLDILVSVYLSGTAVVLLALERVRTIVFLTLAEVLVSLAGILALTPKLGIVGVATGMLMANAILGFGFQMPIVARDLQSSGRAFARATVGPMLAAMLPALIVAVILREMLGELTLIEVTAAIAAISVAYLAGFIAFGLRRDEWQEALRAAAPLLERMPRVVRWPIERLAAVKT
jgi:O-antigen/teichoic acid export membrane protein